MARALALLDRLAAVRQPMSMSRLASDLSLPRSSVHGLCSTLLSMGYLRRVADGSLSIGPRVMGLAEAFVASTDVVREFEALWQSEVPEETVLLSVLDGADVVYLAARNGARPLGLAFAKGMRLPAHLAATGRAMLACHGADALQAVLAARPLAALTPRSLTDPQALHDELVATRARGYAVDDEGVRMGVYSLAAPVLDASGQPVAGVGVSLNKATLESGELARQRDRVLDTARLLSQRVGGSGALVRPPSTPMATQA